LLRRRGDGVAAIGVATQSVGLPQPCRTPSQCSSSLCSESYVGVVTLGLATLGVGLPSSRHMASPCSSSLYSESWVDVGTTGVAALGVSWQRRIMWRK
jgi:hypothetical protein